MTPSGRSDRQRITHGRHCTCGACAREDWTKPDLAPCGMHGEACPRSYQPWGRAGSTGVTLTHEGQEVAHVTPERIAELMAEQLERVSAERDRYRRALELIESGHVQATHKRGMDEQRHIAREALAGRGLR